MSVIVKIDVKKMIERVTNDRFGTFVSSSWKKLLDPYTPRDTGFLMGITGQTVEIRPFEIHYKAPYAEIDYFNYRGVTFITAGSGRNPFATDHWDKKAEQAGQTEKLYRTLNAALRSGQY